MAIHRFEEILAWQSARRLVREVYAVTRTEGFISDRALRDQLQRASVSTMSNIAEGFERETARDFLHFLSIARASNAEVRSLLYVAHDLDLVDNLTFRNLMAAADETSRLVSGFRKSIEHRANGVREEVGTYDLSSDPSNF